MDNDKPIEKCGVVAAAVSGDAAPYIYYSLWALQHRGQEIAGIATFDNGINCIKKRGLVHEVFGPEEISSLKGTCGIGHVLYSIKLSKYENFQPVVVNTSVGDIAVGHNGIIINSKILREELKAKGHAFVTDTEEEAMIYILADELSSTGNVVRALKNMTKKLIGSYSLVFIINGRIFALRDEYGIKPLCIGKLDNGYVVASESVALDAIDAKLVRDVSPGEIVELKSTSIESTMIASPKNTAHCVFEWVYFARPDSLMDGRYGYEVRIEIGKRLAREYPVKADLVCPIPDSGRTHALGYSMESKIPYSEGLMKNRYIGRTFIMPHQEMRDLSIKMKLNTVRPLIEGKRIVLVDDSIVRGSTIKKIVQFIRNANAKEIHIRIGFPPIVAPCYFGIDMTNRGELIASAKTVDEIAKEIAADSLEFLTVKELVESIGKPYDDLCLGCLTKEYPIEISGERVRFQKSLDLYK
ncbi:MAG: amidophosphoribosyltransferase [Thermoplasmata archaeon]